MSYWRGKRCLITGGTAGLGLVVARELAQRQAEVLIGGRDAERLEAAAADLRQQGARVETFAGDVAAPGVVAELVAQATSRLGGLDFVCHAAGRSMRGELLATSNDDFEALWRLNTFASFELAKHTAEALCRSRGHLVLIGSLASRVAPRFLGAYPTSKFPLAALAQQLRLEQGPRGLHTLLVCPGPIRRDDPSPRYDHAGGNIPSAAGRPGGGAKVSLLDPHEIALKILRACERRQGELILPAKARWLFVLSQLSTEWGDWLLRKMSS